MTMPGDNNKDKDTSNGKTGLTVYERRSILKAPILQYGLDVIPCRTADKADDKKRLNMFKNKKTEILSEERTDEYYLNRLEAGDYDDGCAIICGVIRRGKYKDYKFAVLDIDRKKGLEEFLDSGDRQEDLQHLADMQYVEWNGFDKDERIHIPLILEPDAEIAPKGADTILGIEIIINGVMFGFGSPHHKGLNYMQYGNADVTKIRIYSKTLAFTLQEHIISVCSKNGVNYFTDKNSENKAEFYKAYTAHLHASDTKIKVGERHDVHRFICPSYFFKHGGEWDALSDDQRYERVLGYDRTYCTVPLSETDPEELLAIWQWCVKNCTGRRQQERDEREDMERKINEKYKDTLEGLSEGKQRSFRSYQTVVQDSLSGNIWSETGTWNWIVANTRENIIYRCYQDQVGKDSFAYYIFVKAERILKCIPISITKHENPFDDLGMATTYTIVFKNTIGKTYTLTNLTLDSNADWLKSEGYIMPTSSRGGSLIHTLSAMVDAFLEDGRLVTERGAHFEGYYFDQGDIQVSRINLEEKHPRCTSEECVDCADFLEKRAKCNIYSYNDKKIDRQADLATSIKWAIVAPFNFVIKQLTGNYLKALSFSGERDGGKTETALEILDIHGHRTDDRRLGGQSIYSRKVGDMNTEAKFGRCVDKTTYPILGNEFGRLESYGRDERLLETAKNAIEFTICRTGKRDSRYDSIFMSAASLAFTGNAVLSTRGEIVKRCDTMKYSIEDRHEKNDSKTIAFNEFMKNNRYKYKTLGDWTINYILDNKQELLLSKKYDCYQLMDIVIKAFYDNIGKQVPEWLTRWISDTSLEELDVDEESIIRAILFEHVNNAVRQNYQLIFSATEKEFKYCLSISEKVDRCLKNHLLSFIRPIYSRQKTVTDGKMERVVDHYEIDSSIKMLFDQLLPDITLIKIAQKMNFEHARNGKGSVIKFTADKLTSFLEGQPVDENTAENGGG